MAAPVQDEAEVETKIKIRNPPVTFKSNVWKYFGFRADSDEKDKTICRLCYQEVSYKGGNTTNMATHLRRKHTIVSGSETALTSKINTHKSCSSSVSGASGQLKLADMFHTKLSSHSPRARVITQSIAAFICKDMRPFSVVENEGFCHLVNTLEPRFTLPSRTHFADKVLPDIFKTVTSRVSAELKKASSVAITTDGWTSRATESFITITAHFIDSKWDIQNHVLQTRPLHKSHTGENLANVLTMAIDNWGLKKSNRLPPITTDNASNITCGVKAASLFPHVKCFAHTLNLATQKALQIGQLDRLLGRVRRIVTFFHKSTTATAALKSKQMMLELPQHKLIMDVSTRWNSTYDMLSRYLDLQPAIYAALMTKEVKKNLKDIVTLSPEDVKAMEEMVSVLEPLKTVTTLMCDTKHPTVSMIHPFKEMLLVQMKEKETDSSLVKAVKKHISTDLQPRYTEDATLLFLLESCLLDPRFKTLPYLDDSRRNDVTVSLQMKCHSFDEQVKVVVKEEPPDSEDQAPLPSLPRLPLTEPMREEVNSIDMKSEPDPDEPPVKKCALDQLFCDVFITKEEPPKTALEKFYVEIENYKSEKSISLQSDPLKWWKDHETQYPLLAKMAKYYLGIPATSVPSERVFSSAGEIVSSQRASLTGDTIDMLIFLKSNMIIPNDLKI